MNKSYLYILLFLSIVLIGIEGVSGACVTPQTAITNASMNISGTITLCTGNYNFMSNDTQSYLGVRAVFLGLSNNAILDGNGSTINMTNTSTNVYFSFITANNVTIKNITVNGQFYRVITSSGSQNVTIQDSLINATSTNTARIYIDEGTSRFKVLRTIFTNSTARPDISIFGSNSTVISSCTFYNDTTQNIAISGSNGFDNVVNNSNFYNDAYYSIYVTGLQKTNISYNSFNFTSMDTTIAIQLATGVSNNTINNNILRGNNSLIYLFGDNLGISLINNTCYGNVSADYGCMRLEHTNSSILDGNKFIGGLAGLYIVAGNNLTVRNSNFTHNDKGMDIYTINNSNIINNLFNTIDGFMDEYDLPIAVSGGDNLNISSNNFLKTYTVAVWLQKVSNSRINLNYFDMMNITEKQKWGVLQSTTGGSVRYNSSDDLQAPSAILLSPAYKSYNTYSACDGNFNFNKSCYDKLNNTNIDTTGNTYSSGTQIFLISDSSNNITTEFTRYDSGSNWYRKFNPFFNYSNDIEYFMSQSYNNITLIGLNNQTNNTISSGYEFITPPITLTISKSEMTFRNNGNMLINWTSGIRLNASTKVIIYGALNYLPYNDVKNVSTNTILASNIDNYSLTLVPNQQIGIGNYSPTIVYSITHSSNVNNGFINVSITGVNDASFSNYSINLYDSSLNLVSTYLLNTSSGSYTFSSLTGNSYYVQIVERDTSGNLNPSSYEFIDLETHGSLQCTPDTHFVYSLIILAFVSGILIVIVRYGEENLFLKLGAVIALIIAIKVIVSTIYILVATC